MEISCFSSIYRKNPSAQYEMRSFFPFSYIQRYFYSEKNQTFSKQCWRLNGIKQCQKCFQMYLFHFLRLFFLLLPYETLFFVFNFSFHYLLASTHNMDSVSIEERAKQKKKAMRFESKGRNNDAIQFSISFSFFTIFFLLLLSSLI